MYGGNIYCFIYSISGLSIEDFISKDNLHFIIFDIIALIIMISHINVIQSDIKAKFVSAKFKCYFKLINLFTTLLLIVHMFVNFVIIHRQFLCFLPLILKMKLVIWTILKKDKLFHG